MLALMILAAETVDAAEEGKKVITGMLVVGLIFAGVVVLGELSKAWRHRRKRARRAGDVNAWRPVKQHEATTLGTGRAARDPPAMRQLPTGTVTLLFTDIEGSTRLLHELGDGYAAVLAEHRRILRDAFARVTAASRWTRKAMRSSTRSLAQTDAAAAADDAQRALSAGPVRVRIGVHTGEPRVTDEGYVGADVHRAARIMSAGHGGQVLVSEATRRLLDSAPLRDLGEHRLKDLELPERIFQLGKGAFPPLKSLNNTNLPQQLEPLLGRKRGARRPAAADSPRRSAS